jgi:hypothetical protein
MLLLFFFITTHIPHIILRRKNCSPITKDFKQIFCFNMSSLDVNTSYMYSSYSYSSQYREVLQEVRNVSVYRTVSENLQELSRIQFATFRLAGGHTHQEIDRSFKVLWLTAR